MLWQNNFQSMMVAKKLEIEKIGWERRKGNFIPFD